ncbi:biotin-dependent carboxyltransferase family protein [Seonamhaeicola sp. MEBiC1930]|uniref:5-oxoprolinase subunit C family protein n=1 Tax=Seonamhaeicola sp. MEBiC01930 TaxID=2976768 RepID=UPI0032553C39
MIKVLTPGLYTTIQDLGRFGYQRYGVPYSGVMDRTAASFANAILGNNTELPVLEITMMGPKLQFSCQTSICVSGADISPKLNNQPIFNNKVISIKSGDIFSFGRLNKGVRAYLAVLGGFKTKMVMQSCSMYQGITNQFKIHKHDLLDISTKHSLIKGSNASIKVNDYYFNSKDIEVFEGPEFDKLDESQKKFLFSQEFTISKDNNRMAYQLNEVLGNNLKPIITSPVMPGTIQLTPSGKLIILMRDCQTTGGYPRVLQLKESAISVLSQKHTGESIRFLKF